METEDSEMCRWYQNNTCKEPCGDCSTTIRDENLQRELTYKPRTYEGK